MRLGLLLGALWGPECTGADPGESSLVLFLGMPWIAFWIGLARALDRLFGLPCAGAGLGGIELGAFFRNVA